ncbi:MAG: PAS domain S-box protein [Desulfarculus sp.]|nr:PAS domain S-box protein [Desulfarculus sp.]
MSAQATPTRTPKMPLAALAVLALAIALTGYFYLQYQLAGARRAARQEIMAIAGLKVSQITAWLGERRGNAGAIVRNPIMRGQVRNFMGGGGEPGLGEELRAWLEGMRLRYGYEQLAFYDASGNPRLGAPWPLPTLDTEGLAEALVAPDVIFTDLHQVGLPGGEGHPPARLTLWAPIPGGPGQPALGAMQLLVDPQAILFPMVRGWPTPSPSAEVLLLRREGQDAVVLAETRHHHQTGHSLRQPLEPPGCLPMALAVLGGEMPEEGAPDHRGVPVLAVSRPVPGTPWFLVAKVDLEEVHGGLRQMAWSTGLVMVLLFLAAAAGLGLFWRQRDNQWLRRQLAVDSERRDLAQRVIQLNQQANDIVLLMDEDWQILEANQRAVEAYGYSHTELLGMSVRGLRAPAARAAFDRQVAVADLRAGAVYETLHQRKDGSLFPVEVSIRQVELGGERYRQSFIRDISERQRAQQALAKSEAELSAIFHGAPVMMILVDQDRRVVKANRAALEGSGRGEEGALGLRGGELLRCLQVADHPQGCGFGPACQQCQVRDAMQHTLDTGQPIHRQEVRLDLDKGQGPFTAWFLISTSLLQNDTHPLVLVSLEDIGERKRAEEERRGHIHFLESLAAVDQAIKSENDLERMLWRVVQAVFDKFECDRAWLFYPADPQAPTFRVPVEVCRPEYPGAGALDTDMPMPADMAQDLAHILSSEEPSLFGPGQAKPVNTMTAEGFSVQSQMVVPVFPKTGKPWVFGLHQCSHPRVWTSEERKLFREIGRRLEDGLSSLLFLRGLGESEERFRATFEQAAVGMAHCDPQGRYLRVNRRFCDFLGYSPEEMLTLSFAEVTHPEDRSQDLAQIARLIAGELEVYSRQKRYLKKDGAVAWARLTVSAVRGAQGQALYLIAVVEDITEQRHLEAQLRQAQKMEAMGTLAGGIAHDFNNILGAVLGYAEMAMDDAKSRRVDPRDLEQVIQAALRAKNLVKQILTFSRKSEAELKPLDLNQAVGQARAILERTLPKMIEIETRLAPDLAPVNGDPNQLEQVLLNLATNAQDAMPQGGRLVIETQNVSLDPVYASQHPEVPPGAYALLMVSDSGQGMDAATRDKAFDPFFTTKGVGKGTGLGLSMVYGIVKVHRGHVFCYSEPGLGTTFKIYLPVYTEQAPPGAAPEQELDEEGLRGSETILLVDDEEPLRQVGGRILEGAGYRVLTAASGEQALEVFAGMSQPPGLVVMDLGMPGMGGQKCLERLLALAPGQRVVIASGYAVAGQVRQALEAGARGYVSKPFRRLELLSQVRAVLDRD